MTEGNELRLERIMDAPRDKIWQCWRDTALLEKWFCPRPWYVSDAKLELKPGGEFSTVMHGPNGEEFANAGVVLEVEPGKRLVTTDAFVPGWKPSGRPFIVADLTLEDAGDGKTRYSVVVRHWTEEARAEHEAMGFHEGWGKAADQLEELAQRIAGE